MKIFITGSSGFIGFGVAKYLLNKGHKIHGFDNLNKYYDVNLKKARHKILKKNTNFSFTKGSLENKVTLKRVIAKFKPSIIIHQAAQAGVRYSLDNPRVYLDSNIIGTFNIIEISKLSNVKHLLIASSSSVYGANKKIPFKEIDKTESQLSIYASTKKATESLAHAYSSLWKLPITMMRFFTVYGPWGRPDMALFKFTNAIVKNKKIDVYNNGNMYRDFTYIDDVVKSVCSLINKKPNLKDLKKYKQDSLSSVAPFRTVNIGNSKKIKLLDFIKSLEVELGKKAIPNYLPMQKGDVKNTLANTSLLKKLTGFVPKTNHQNGVKKFVDWYFTNYKK
jgi:UDP-glucuronate 4-epimerase